jgi:uncharacterized alkaline shock family protein YloU
MMILNTKVIVSCLVLLTVTGTAFSQKKHNHDDAVVTIKINGKERDIEEYFEDWGEEFGKKIERMFDDPEVHIDFDEDDFNVRINNISVDIEDFAESIADAVTEAVTNMTIELEDIDPDNIDRHHFNFRDDDDMDDLLDEIEDRYDSKVENIDKLKIKIREDYVKIDLDVTLENGRHISKSRIYED